MTKAVRQPDPSWPPAPHDGALRKKTRSRRRRRIFVGSAVGLLALVGGLLVAAQAYDTLTGCGSVDPTDPANYTVARIVNDTSAEVVVNDCAGAYCQPEDLLANLSPGRSLQVQGACGVTGTGMTSWRLSKHGAVLGYVAIDTRRSRKGVVYQVSDLSPDRSTPTHPLVGGTPSS
jgi:hypothetical protein